MERKNFLKSLLTGAISTPTVINPCKKSGIAEHSSVFQFKSPVMKRLLTSLCGVLLIASIVLTSNCLDMETSQQSHGILFKALLIVLNLVFTLVFLASTLALIKEENKS